MDPAATHQRALLTAVMQTYLLAGPTPVLELGAGWYSTPLLHELCYAQNRPLVTVDNDREWLAAFEAFGGPWHVLRAVGWWGEFQPAGRYGVVLVDHAPACRREDETRRLLDVTDVFVFHDAEERRAYGYDRVFAWFKWTALDTTHEVQTMLASNTVDVTAWLS